MAEHKNFPPAVTDRAKVLETLLAAPEDIQNVMYGVYLGMLASRNQPKQ